MYLLHWVFLEYIQCFPTKLMGFRWILRTPRGITITVSIHPRVTESQQPIRAAVKSQQLRTQLQKSFYGRTSLGGL